MDADSNPKESFAPNRTAVKTEHGKCFIALDQGTTNGETIVDRCRNSRMSPPTAVFKGSGGAPKHPEIPHCCGCLSSPCLPTCEFLCCCGARQDGHCMPHRPQTAAGQKDKLLFPTIHPHSQVPCQAGAQRRPLSVWDVCPSHCHGQIAFRGALPAFPRLDPKRTAFFLRNRLFVLEGFCCYLLTSLNCITPRYASDLHSLNPALFGRICHYSN